MKLRMRLLWLVALLCAMPASAQDNALPQPTITLYVTVDWEGLSLNEENLEAIREFRRAYPHIAMLHLLNPVYFLQPGINTADTTAKIRSVLLPGDEHGLHLHGWKSLVEYCKVEYKSEPSFAGAAEQCEDGSWLLDGLIPIPELKDKLVLKETPEEDKGRYHTLSGMMMWLLGRLPNTGDSAVWENWQFEVVDLDGKRIDKVLAKRLPELETPGEEGSATPADQQKNDRRTS